MRRSVEVQLVGGPADGHLVCIPGDPMDPPQTYRLLAASRTLGTRWVLYRREVNPFDEGPLWLYRFEGSGPA